MSKLHWADIRVLPVKGARVAVVLFNDKNKLASSFMSNFQVKIICVKDWLGPIAWRPHCLVGYCLPVVGPVHPAHTRTRKFTHWPVHPTHFPFLVGFDSTNLTLSNHPFFFVALQRSTHVFSSHTPTPGPLFTRLTVQLSKVRPHMFRISFNAERQ